MTDAANSNDATPVTMPGRCRVGEGEEFACTATMWNGLSAEIACGHVPRRDQEGLEAICYLEGFGRVAGFVRRIRAIGYEVAIEAGPERLARIEERLAWRRLHTGVETERRAATRIVPVHRATVVRDPAGKTFEAEIADLSMSGAALLVPEIPEVGATITVGKRFATVVRHLDEGMGIGVAFRLPYTPDTFNEHVVL